MGGLRSCRSPLPRVLVSPGCCPESLSMTWNSVGRVQGSWPERWLPKSGEPTRPCPLLLSPRLLHGERARVSVFMPLASPLFLSVLCP